MKFIRSFGAFTAAFITLFCLCTASSAETKVLHSIKCTLYYTDEYTAVKALPYDPADKIYYTTDGSVPDTKSSVYTKKLGFKSAATLKLAEYNKSGELISAVKTVTVERLLPKPKIIIKDKLDGTAEAQMSCSVEGAEIHYTTDGKTPTVSSPVLGTGYGLLIKGDRTIKAIAVKKGWKTSEAASLKPLDLVTEDSYNDYVQAALKKTNEIRAESGLYALKLNKTLCNVAYLRAKELSQNYANGHTRPNGKRWTTAVIEGGYIYTYASENYGMLDREGINPESIMDLWMISKDHSDAILNTLGHDVGFGFYQTGGFCYWIQLFGEPM